jgi:hypothetical protein
MVIVLTKEDESRAELLYDAMLEDKVLIEIMDGANKVSVGDGQVEHGFPHALNVGGRIDQDGKEGLTWSISKRINELRPGSITPYQQILAGSGGLLHDSGRSIAVKDHHMHSAKLADEYLRKLATRLFGSEDQLPEPYRRRVVELCVKHRADSWLYKNEEEKKRRKREIDGADIALLLLADKLCGSESRVPAAKLAMMKKLAKFNVGASFRKRWNLGTLKDKWSPARISWGNPEEIAAAGYTKEFIKELRIKLKKNGITIPHDLELDHHDQVNGSIEDRVIEIFEDDRLHETEPTKSKYWGTMLYSLTVNEHIATQQLVTGLDWWHEAFHVCAKAAKFLGLRFLIEFNGRILRYDLAEKNWSRVKGIHA